MQNGSGAGHDAADGGEDQDQRNALHASLLGRNGGTEEWTGESILP
jgi:hypothetical protein